MLIANARNEVKETVNNRTLNNYSVSTKTQNETTVNLLRLFFLVQMINMLTFFFI